MKFKIDDGRGMLPDNIPLVVRDIITIVSDLPNGTLLTTRGLAGRLKRSLAYVVHHTADPALVPHRCQPSGKKAYWGNTATIKEAKRTLE